MSLVTVVLSVCLITATPTDAKTCKDVRLAVEPPDKQEQLTPFWCQRLGTVEAQEWLSKNPKWRLERFSCPPPRADKLDI